MGGTESRETQPRSLPKSSAASGSTATEIGPPTAAVRFLRYVRTPRRPRFVVELALVALSYWVYSLIRNAVPNRESLAMERAWQLLDFEKTLHIDIEYSINHAINKVTWLIVGMNYYYATLHFVVTIGVLVWLFHWHPGRYGAVRWVLFITTALALFGYFFYALAPPRLLPGAGYIDTVLVHETWGSMASGDMKNVSNQFAAMPSMHIGWSTWCALAIWKFARPLWVRVLGLLYPLLTLTVIMATGNHFLLDAVGGWVTLAAGFAIQRLVFARSAYRFPRYTPDDPRSEEYRARTASEDVPGGGATDSQREPAGVSSPSP
ncbi:phosphatase PAP2 family protein [Yinghuangia sp. ASG 101]|uniref:phosphatase PAP2 family protein n=1 Tax=Yinghuangia sp. ASG 101 TaxID=2896848 RepID=UPI001E2E3BAD|nr:phosphatase PAP2 family protein [Yinghuangia sp. ASG 101]UGQ09946.1 phosphatase PAP2 family protein [Yinghuangia sp. ASG 101]